MFALHTELSQNQYNKQWEFSETWYANQYQELNKFLIAISLKNTYMKNDWSLIILNNLWHGITTECYQLWTSNRSF